MSLQIVFIVSVSIISRTFDHNAHHRRHDEEKGEQDSPALYFHPINNPVSQVLLMGASGSGKTSMRSLIL